MREIKFRAWDKEEGKIYPNFQDTYMLADVISDNNESRGDSRYILMQYTGLKDKNGKEIYEGDILLAKDWGQKERFVGPVKFQITEFVVMYHKLSNKTWTQLTNLAEPGNLDEWEVIGNIYENPELIK